MSATSDPLLDAVNTARAAMTEFNAARLYDDDACRMFDRLETET